MQHVTLFDTSIATDNLGDEIIMDAVTRHLRAMYPTGFFTRIATHDRIGALSRRYAREADASFVGGTNLLRSPWFYRGQWKIGLLEAWRVGHPILMGVGWQYYKGPVDMLTRWLMRRLLGTKHLHSVRDNYTLERLRRIGVTRVLNTACPTMWELTPEHCARIPRARAANALITLTAYRPDLVHDGYWVRQVLAQYGKVYFWPQMADDESYLQALLGVDAARVIRIAPTLAAYDTLLAGDSSAGERESLDYIGTRLHGGIRALQQGRRSLILEIDNRATEIARDTGLPTLPRQESERLAAWIEGEAPTVLQVPWDAIERWKAQFNPALSIVDLGASPTSALRPSPMMCPGGSNEHNLPKAHRH